MNELAKEMAKQEFPFLDFEDIPPYYQEAYLEMAKSHHPIISCTKDENGSVAPSLQLNADVALPDPNT